MEAVGRKRLVGKRGTEAVPSTSVIKVEHFLQRAIDAVVQARRLERVQVLCDGADLNRPESGSMRAPRCTGVDGMPITSGSFSANVGGIAPPNSEAKWHVPHAAFP